MSNYTDVVSKIGKDTSRSACKKCGYAGHLTFQCRNFIKVCLHFCTLDSFVLHKYVWLFHNKASFNNKTFLTKMC